MTQKKLFIIILIILTVIIGAVLSVTAFSMSASNAAKDDIAIETLRLQSMTESVLNDTSSIRQELNEVEAELSSSDTMNNYYMERKKEHDSLVQEINDLNQKISELDEKIDEKRSENTNSPISGTKTGKKYQLKANESYACPDKLPAGRYTAKGSGMLTIINSSGHTRVSHNLSVSFDNTYTFDIYAKEKLQVTGAVMLTELK